MGVSFDDTCCFVFPTEADATAFRNKWEKLERTESYGAHFNVTVPVFITASTDKTVTISSEGYGVFDLTEFKTHNVKGVVRHVYSCQSQDIYYVVTLLAEEFTYNFSDPYQAEDNFGRECFYHPYDRPTLDNEDELDDEAIDKLDTEFYDKVYQSVQSLLNFLPGVISKGGHLNTRLY
jgi:hypothetical protein